MTQTGQPVVRVIVTGETLFLPGIPEAGRAGGQLKRFVDTFGMGLDTLRNGAEGLRFLRQGMRGFYATFAGAPLVVRTGDLVLRADDSPRRA